MRVARTSAIFALPWTVSVTMPACEPVSEIASWPRSWTAIAQRELEIRSPTEMSMSYSRGCGRGEISCASLISSSVESPIAERTPTTRPPSSHARTSRRATSLIFSVSATEVPPNFITTRSRPGDAASATSGTVSCTVMAESCLGHLSTARERSSERHFVGVFEVAADREAAREARDANAIAKPAREIGRGRLAGRVRVRGEHDLDHAVALDAVEELVDPQVLRFDPVERRERPAEDVVEAAVLRRPLDRDEVDRLLDDADRRPVTARVEADRAQLLLGEVAALAAEADAFLHLADRRGERERLLLLGLEDVEGEPLRRSAADSRQPRQLRDEVLDRRAEHGVRVLAPSGRAGTGRAGTRYRRGPSGRVGTRYRRGPSGHVGTWLCRRQSPSRERLARREVERPAPDDHADQGEDEGRPEPVREEVAHLSRPARGARPFPSRRASAAPSPRRLRAPSGAPRSRRRAGDPQAPRDRLPRSLPARPRSRRLRRRRSP